jgi:hypothetical protein
MQNKILMNKAGEGDAGGAPNPPASETPPANPPANPPAEDDGLDELGYEKRAPEKKEGDPPAEADDKKKAPAKEPTKVENPATGYGEEPPKVDDPPPADPNKKVDPPPEPTEIEKKLEGLNKAFADQVKKQITEIGLEGEKLDKFIAFKKQEQADAVAWQKANQEEADRQDKLRKASWHKELKEDPVFGGDKFLTNVTRGEKVLDEYLPELKKELTEAKQMLRPSVMRGLARLADMLYPDDKLVQGDPPPVDGGKNDKNEKNDPLAFYE